MSHLKALFLVVLLGTTPTLAAGGQPSEFPCWSQSGDELSGAVDESVYPPCPVVLPPTCRMTDPTCALFWLVPTDGDVGRARTIA